MSTNCLLTKLNSVCQNSNLRELGSLRLDIVTLSYPITGQVLQIGSSAPIVLKSDKNIFLSDGTYVNYLEVCNPSASSPISIKDINEPFYIDIIGKYSINTMLFKSSNTAPVMQDAYWSSNKKLFTEEFTYCDNLSTFEVIGLPEVNITDFSHWKGLTTFALSRCTVQGTIESFVEKYLENFPSVNKVLKITLYLQSQYSGNCTFNGNLFGDQTNDKIVFNGDGTASVYQNYDSPVLLGTYNGTSWTYA